VETAGAPVTTVEFAVRSGHGERRRLEVRVFANVEVPSLGQQVLIWQDFQTYVVEAVEPYQMLDNNEPPEERPDLTVWLRLLA
jgi:hypothetical protein